MRFKITRFKYSCFLAIILDVAYINMVIVDICIIGHRNTVYKSDNYITIAVLLNYYKLHISICLFIFFYLVQLYYSVESALLFLFERGPSFGRVTISSDVGSKTIIYCGFK